MSDIMCGYRKPNTTKTNPLTSMCFDLYMLHTHLEFAECFLLDEILLSIVAIKHFVSEVKSPMKAFPLVEVGQRC